MMQPTDTELQIVRVFKASPEKLFDAWSDPDLLKIWMGGKAVDSPYAEVDFRVGGKYLICLQPPGGKPFTVQGVYQQIDPPHKISYTWTFVDAEIETGETLVTVEFLSQGDHTQVTLSHQRFPDATIRDIHHEGWNGLLDNLAELLTTI